MESVLPTLSQNVHDFINSAPSNHFLQYMFEQFLIFIPYTSQAIHSSKVLPPLPTFITLVAQRSRSKAGTLLAAVVLLQRLKKKIDQNSNLYSQDLILHEVVLGIVILTTKWLHDASPKNSRWAKYVGYYSTEEINAIERKLLGAMDYQPKIPKEDFASVFENYRRSVSVHSSLLSPDTIDQQQHLPRSASSSSLPRSSSNKSSSLYSLVQHLKWSIADFKKSPNSGKTKATSSDRLKLPSKVAHSSPMARINHGSSGVDMPLGYENILSGSSSSSSNASSVDLIQATSDIFLSLSQHISLSSLDSDSTIDIDSITTPLAYPDSNDSMAIRLSNKKI
ncbi:hypothetical protein G6F70_003611 [Rhizopus microsporus]|uniref:Cyclin N-terminal domain-containing protein n=2 Tax=Rhizopus TaxID=4842 RepID=A0A367KH66_RHIAZ|nr:hypothetical protein G6F71_001243 [Rhizopus microsporus]KAG1200940.1 hypothetical protein G6F70_003611 [Rhizopus microsporus]KAG1212858.1 hypothetical protein G6F69_003340 [Rhizopus microsporus]RCI01499.1 hypothetical protein CU097_014269 [Rhizopus azygosporus]CEI93989.1 hypothetical protein RMCBS344292_08211 [Rhizopus microsporus]